MKLPRYPLDFNPRSFGYEFESFKIYSRDGTELNGWLVPARRKTDRTIVALHGWGANRSDALAATVFLAEQFNLVYFDFRNHGESGGNKTSLTCLEISDFESVISWLKTEKSATCVSLGVYGFSMGGAVAISGAAKVKDIRAVVAESPFTSYNETVKRFAKIFYGVPGFAVPLTLWFTRKRLRFDPEPCSPIHWVGQISPRPLFIIQGGADARMPPSEGQALYDAAHEPKQIWVVPGADHGDARTLAEDEYKKRILDFFVKWIK